jgi:MFS family permease
MAAAQGIQQLALAWLVLDLTGSVAQLGLVVFARGIPMLVFGLYGGVIADRHNRRNVLIWNQALTLVNMALLSAAVLAGSADLWMVYISSILLGLASALTAPARQAMIRSLVNNEDMLNAVALNSFQMNASRIIWPTMAGGLITITGTGGAFVVCAVASLVGIVFLLPIKVDASAGADRRNVSPLQGVIEGVKFTMSVPVLVMVMTLVVAIGMFGLTFQNMAPAFAREAMDFGAAETGLFMMATGVGSLIGTAMLLVFDVKNRNLLIVCLAVGFGLSLVALAVNPTYAGSFILVAVVGLFSSSVPVVAQTIFQIVVPQQFLGRVNSLLMTAPGLAAVVALPIGLLGDEFGLRWAVGGIGVLLAAISLGAGIYRLPRLPRNEDEAARRAESIPAGT